MLQTHVQANLYGMGHDPELFPEPEIFRPERWLRGTDDSAKALANLPWGHGARMCLGKQSTVFLTTIIISYILVKGLEVTNVI